MSNTELFTLLDRAQSGDDEACQKVLLENGLPKNLSSNAFLDAVNLLEITL